MKGGERRGIENILGEAIPGIRGSHGEGAGSLQRELETFGQRRVMVEEGLRLQTGMTRNKRRERRTKGHGVL